MAGRFFCALLTCVSLLTVGLAAQLPPLPIRITSWAVNGQGEGKMSVATKISFNKKHNTVELENYASEPVRLTNVKVEKK